MMDTSRKDAGMNGDRWDAGRNGTNPEDMKRNGAKLKDNGVNAVGMKNVKRENSQKGNTKGKNARIKDVWNKSYLNPKEDPRFHDTYKFLRRYRDATYSLKVVVHQMEKQFRLKYGTRVDEFLDSIYAAGAELSGDDIEERAKSLRPHISNISYRTYYRKRHAAIEALSTILWGFTAKETIEILNEFFPED